MAHDGGNGELVFTESRYSFGAKAPRSAFVRRVTSLRAQGHSNATERQRAPTLNKMIIGEI